MPPVIVEAGSRADLKLIPVVPVPVPWSGNPEASITTKAPERVPFIGKVKFTLAVLLASVVNDVIFVQLEKFCGYGQNCRTKVEFPPPGSPLTCVLPAPLFAAVSTVMVPTGPGFLLIPLIQLARNASGVAGVGLGDGFGLGDGEGIGVGVGVGRILLETEPQPASSSKSPVNKIKVTARTKSSLEPGLSVTKGNVLIGRRAAAGGRLSWKKTLPLQSPRHYVNALSQAG
jgi:hypothetical protein